MDQINLNVIRRPHDPNVVFEWLAPDDTAPQGSRVSKVMITPQNPRRSFGSGTTYVPSFEAIQTYYLTDRHALLFYAAGSNNGSGNGQIVKWPFIIEQPADFLAAIILPDGNAVWTWDESDPDIDTRVKEALADYQSVN